MEFKDCYKVLGVERTTSDDEIKKAFRRLARGHHPEISKAPKARPLAGRGLQGGRVMQRQSCSSARRSSAPQRTAACRLNPLMSAHSV